MSRAPSTGTGSSYSVRSVHRLAIAPVPETPCIASLATSSADDSDDSVRISLGIQQGLTQAWSAALDRLGSMSLAWQSEAAFARGRLTQLVDPTLIFDGVNTPASALLDEGPPEKPANFNNRRRGRKDAAASRFVASAMPTWYLKGPPSIVLEGVTADHVRFGSSRFLGGTLPESPARHSPRSAMSATLALSPSARAARKTPGHRLSIKLERLLPPRTPESSVVGLHTPAMTTRSARGPSRRHSVLSDPTTSRRRASSHPQPATKGARSASQRDITGAASSATDAAPGPKMCALSAFDRLDSTGSPHDEHRLASLEAQVSDMFCELGLRSPYIQASRPAEQRTLTGSVHRGPEQTPWFYQRQYAKPTPHSEGRPARHIVLVDDDSSCPDNAAEPSIRCHSRDSRHYKEATQMAFPGLQTTRRPTSTSMLSAADESISSTIADSAHAPRVCEYAQYSAFCDHDLPCRQMHSIQQRIEQADQHIHSVSRHALAISNMLADLRTQSRALAETLAASQARTSPLPDKLPVAGQPLRPGHTPESRVDNVTATRILDRPTANLPQEPKLSRRACSQGAQAADVASQCTAWISGSGSANSEQVSRSRTRAQRQGHYALIHAEVVPEDCDIETDSPEALKPPKSTRGAKQSTKHTKPGQHRRPAQPVSVRLQRIDAQWSELCKAIADLGIDMATTDVTNKHSPHHSAKGIAVGGLKSIQRVLKATLESLSAFNASQVQGSSDGLAAP